MRLKTTIIAALMLLASAGAPAQTKAEFKQASDSLRVLLKQETTHSSVVSIDKAVRRGAYLDIYFTQELSDFQWTKDRIQWLRHQLIDLMPEKYTEYSLGNIYAKNTKIDDLVTPSLGHSGKPSEYKYKVADRRDQVTPIVTRRGRRTYSKGLSGRHIALWQSHGRYFDEGSDRWRWQRAPLFTTVEDMYTQSYVLPFLIPMLENSGAYVLTPRERDIQKYEVIADNDIAFPGERSGLLRRRGSYQERGRWSDAGTGFADAKQVYYGNDNPFTMGTARKAPCATEEDGQKAEARWTFTVPEDGQYAVYISYKTLRNSCEDAHYTVRHLAGDTEFSVNQKMGGGTWIYLGTFDFGADKEGAVILDNITDARYAKSVITADAVKIGGGMGKIARGRQDTPQSEWTTSGLPCFAEGALYWEQFAGVDTTVTRNWEGDYTQDYASRGAWVSMMAGGSYVNPKYEGEGRNIPFDLSLGFHSDAGFTQNDSIIGTLSIYTLMADGKSTLPDGRSRQLGRHLAGIVQDQVCDDIRSEFEPAWSRRELWNKNYSESRTTSVPGMLLELLSHQNFADAKYGLDPSFRFTVCRAVYKGILKFLSDEYGIPYVVQPLPVNSFSATLSGDGEVTLRWKATTDTVEPTATSERFILYTRTGDGVFDQGVNLGSVQKDGETYVVTVGIDPGEIYSYRIVAENDGGRSFPSEVMSVGQASNAKDKVLVVNNFDRVSPAAWYDTPQYAGFDRALDSGVGYGYEINYVGDSYEHRRAVEWTDDDSPGFGGSFTDRAGEIVPGNTFDFIRIHGKSLMAAGYSFDAASRDAFVSYVDAGTSTVDLLCGKQVTVKLGSGTMPNRYQVFPEGLQKKLKAHTGRGGSVIISGANIGTDVWSEVFPVTVDSLYRESTRQFVKETLGYTWLTDHGCFNALVGPCTNKAINLKSSFKKPFEFYQTRNDHIYSVENPDGLQPADKNGTVFLRYYDNEVPAAVAYTAKGYRTVSLGFPLESIKEDSVRNELITKILDFISK